MRLKISTGGLSAMRQIERHPFGIIFPYNEAIRSEKISVGKNLAQGYFDYGNILACSNF